VASSRGSTLEASTFHTVLAPLPRAQRQPFADLPTLDDLERRYLLHVLEATQGNRTRAAEVSSSASIAGRSRMAERFDRLKELAAATWRCGAGPIQIRFDNHPADQRNGCSQ
jgi:hypothetical protein